MDGKLLSAIPEPLLQWFSEHKRDLPFQAFCREEFVIV